MRRRLLRLFAIATLVAGAFCAALAIPDARAQRIPPEGREIIDNMSRSERRAFRKLDREERRAYILNLLKKRGIVVEPPKETGGDEKRRGPNPKVLATIDGYLPPTAITPEVRMMVGKNSGGDKDRAVEIQKARGVTETGLTPDFIDGGDCPEIDSETWAIDYSGKRAWAALHKGIDIPQPEGTPIRAVADGTVVGKFENRRNRKGIEIMLRHTPEQTGLPFWTYSQYTHMLAMSPLSIGEKVRMGDEIGQTSNTGEMGRRVRRDALHFAILYAEGPGWSADGRFVAPKDGYWMDPNAFYRMKGPYDSKSLAELDEEEKKIPVPYMRKDGGFVPADTKRIWPYTCE